MNRNTFAGLPARRGVLSSRPDPVEHDDLADVDDDDETTPDPDPVDAARPRRRKRTTKPKE